MFLELLNVLLVESHGMLIAIVGWSWTLEERWQGFYSVGVHFSTYMVCRGFLLPSCLFFACMGGFLLYFLYFSKFGFHRQIGHLGRVLRVVWIEHLLFCSLSLVNRRFRNHTQKAWISNFVVRMWWYIDSIDVSGSNDLFEWWIYGLIDMGSTFEWLSLWPAFS